MLAVASDNFVTWLYNRSFPSHSDCERRGPLGPTFVLSRPLIYSLPFLSLYQLRSPFFFSPSNCYSSRTHKPLPTAKMPCIRGIEVFISTKPDGKPIPEYPHPDSFSAHVLGKGEHCGASLSGSSRASKVSPGNQELRRQKSNPVPSVYIPSVPGKLVPYTSHL